MTREGGRRGIRREIRCACMSTCDILYTSRLPMLLAGHTSLSGHFRLVGLVGVLQGETILSRQIRVTRAHVKVKIHRFWRGLLCVFLLLCPRSVYSPLPVTTASPAVSLTL